MVYDDIDSVRRFTPRSEPNEIHDSEEFMRIDREAMAHSIKAPAWVEHEDGYLKDLIARKQSLIPKPTEEEMRSIRDFTVKGYKDINGFLRCGNTYVKKDGEATDMKSILSSIRCIDEYIEKVITPPLTVYRKCKAEIEFPHIGAAPLGRIFKLPAYTSASLSREAAEKFRHPGDVIEIRYPGGKGMGILISDLSVWKNEYELLVKRNSSLALVGTKKKYNHYVFEVVE